MVAVLSRRAYLLGRNADGCHADRRVLVVAGDVHRHVPVMELSEWGARLTRSAIYLHVASGPTREIVLNHSEQQRIAVHVS